MASVGLRLFATVGILSILLSLDIVRRTATLIQLGFGIGKIIQPISDYEYRCRRLRGPGLQACEDLWLSTATRQIFLACSNPEARSRWGPNEGHFNLTGRSTQDSIVVMNPDTLEHKILLFHGFDGTVGDGIINVVGFAGIDKQDGSVELYVTNLRPSIDVSSGQVLPDQSTTGANASIEVFKTSADAQALDWMATFSDPMISTPNRLAVVEGRGLYVTNDHGQRKKGVLSMLSPILGTGDITFCPIDQSQPCKIASAGHSYPNGLVHSHVDNHIYLPSSATGGIKAFKILADDSVELVNEIHLPYAIDNLSEDQNGDIWAAVIPRGLDFLKHAQNPLTFQPPSSVFRIKRADNKVLSKTAEKILEDVRGEVLPGTTTVVHDMTTGRLFLGGGFSSFITVCEPSNNAESGEFL